MEPDPHVTSQLASLPLSARLWSTLSANLRTSTAESLFYFYIIFFLRKGCTLSLVSGSRHWWGWVRDGACEGTRSPLLGKQSNTEGCWVPPAHATPHIAATLKAASSPRDWDFTHLKLPTASPSLCWSPGTRKSDHSGGNYHGTSPQWI